MRVTTSFPLGTLRDTPSEAEIISHQLLLKAGYIRRVSSGIYAYMPIMLKVIEKISAIIEKELNVIGCTKLLLPQLHPADLWKKSERWEGYTAGSDPSRIWPGSRMAGRMGNAQVSVKNLEVARVEKDNNLIFIKGAVPGARNGIVYLSKQ